MAARLRTLLTYIVVTALIAIPVAYLLDPAAHVHLAPRPVQAQRRVGASHPPRVSRSHPASGRIVIIILLALVAAVAIYRLARFIAAYRGTWTGWRRRAASAAIAPSADDDEAGLLEAVESGQSALRRLDDARAAIIACYVAMEDSLARAGTARAAADTPDELLARAAGQGLIRTAAAARLTALFYEARFSSHPMPPGRRDDAQQALAELAASLAEPAPAAGAAAAPEARAERADEPGSAGSGQRRLAGGGPRDLHRGRPGRARGRRRDTRPPGCPAPPWSCSGRPWPRSWCCAPSRRRASLPAAPTTPTPRRSRPRSPATGASAPGWPTARSP